MRSWLRHLLLPAAAIFAVSLYASASLAAAPPRRDPPSGLINYRGFNVLAIDLARLPNGPAIRTALERQIDICIEAGLKPEQLAFIRSVPVAVRIGAKGGSGNYDGKMVTLSPDVYPSDNPVLLHELLHAYHKHRLPGGNNNQDILTFYDRAKTTPGLYPVGSYMLSNVNEYFAMTASVFLYGVAARDPNTRAKLQAKQPNYYQWLSKEFGPH